MDEILKKKYNFKESEKKWQNFWLEKEIYKFDPESEKEIFSIDTPPPTVSGHMHLGHALAYSQMDFIARYQRMKNKNLFYPFGFDDNGLATERFVEKELGIKANSMPREKFRELCLEVTRKTEEKLREEWYSLGISCDWNLYYSTINDYCIKISQLSFIDLYKKNRVYLKEAPTLWCPTCQTAIAQVEMQDVEKKSYFNDIIFKVENEDLIIATTRPELLPACVAVFVHPEDKRYKHLVGKKAKVPLFNYEVPILEDTRVDPMKGSGAVMCCTFGDTTDVEWYLAYNLPLKEAIGKDGKLTEIAGKYKGMSIKEARKAIIEDLKKNNLLVAQRKIKHFVKVHERCGTEIEIIHSKQWFIKYLDLKDKFIELGRKLNWYPEHMRHRYENWVKGLQWDWCISRQRFFGVPFPVWYCKDCGEVIIAEEDQLPVDPTIDKPKVKECPRCGSTNFVPEYDVMDTWATSSLTPMIVSKWKHDDAFFNKIFPMSLRCNGHDIISFWLFNTVVKSYLHENKLPWKDVMINGFVLDEKGEKMCKSKGNVIYPSEIIEKYGADVLRYWAASTSLGEDVLVKEKQFITGKRLVNKLWNASKFAFMHLKDYNLEKPTRLNIIDKWLFTKLNRTIKESTKFFDAYEFSKAKFLTEQFFWNDFCDNYLEIIKTKLYNKDKYDVDTIISTKYTLYNVLLTIIKMFAPIMPHITEEIYHSFFKKYEKKESIHICSWPKEFKDYEDKKAYDAGELLIDILKLARKFKTHNQKPLNYPIIIKVNIKEKELIDLFEEIKEDLVNAAKCKNIFYENKELQYKCESFNVEVDFELSD